MPKIEISQKKLYSELGKKLSLTELEDILTVAKAELDGLDEEEGLLKIELNDTNRPDLWSTYGLARQILSYWTKTSSKYDFIKPYNEKQDTGERVIEVSEELKNIRPYIAGFVIKGEPIDDDMLREIIQMQEKLCWNYGQKRKSIAMGVYRADMLRYPVKYIAADPDATQFVPLGMDKKLSLKKILEEHPKGQDFGWILDGFKKYPFLTDSQGEVLSFPPIINSARLGAVEIGDSNLFIELTGLDIKTLALACNIVACDLHDAGFEILPVTVKYPYDTPLGREVSTPCYFQEEISIDIGSVKKLLGQEFKTPEIGESLEKMGLEYKIEKDLITVKPPVYRNDFLHPVDIAEDIMIGYGINNFVPEMPRDFTVGRLSEAEEYNRQVKKIMIGLGFQEMIFNYLGSRKDYIEKMCTDDKNVIQVANPMSENYEFVRPSILPSLLAAEAASGNAVYPHNIFETGKTAVKNAEDPYGSITINSLGFLSADAKADFNLVSSQVSALLFYLSIDYRLEEYTDPRFIPGRCAIIKAGNANIGIMGEIHPQVLENWGISMPCTACEINLDIINKN
ncbi:phenylalanine--tRNA ligase subunit beta [Spirochaetia bacterium 38H-sp]|uniref:Phenylalanine--tRNA ligase beta subunit n=1 Tax=Rarispira pelagica TaxID=3141764 RepID=A0ABU9UAU9_9SPIR